MEHWVSLDSLDLMAYQVSRSKGKDVPPSARGRVLEGLTQGTEVQVRRRPSLGGRPYDTVRVQVNALGDDERRLRPRVGPGLR